MDKVNALSAEKVSTPIAFFTLTGGEKAQAIVLIAADGTPIESWPLPGGAATNEKLDEVLAKLSADPATQTTLAGILSKLNGAIAVTGTFYPETQPVSAITLPLPTGAAADVTLQAVRDRLPATAHTQPLTDIQLRAVPVPVSLSVAPLPTGAATQATLTQVLAALQATLGVSVGNLPANYPDSGANDKLAQAVDRLADILTELEKKADATEVQNVAQTDIDYVTRVALRAMAKLTYNGARMMVDAGSLVIGSGTVSAVNSILGIGYNTQNGQSIQQSNVAFQNGFRRNLSVAP